MTNTGIRRLLGSATTLLVGSATIVAMSTLPAQAAVTPAWQQIDQPTGGARDFVPLDDADYMATTATGGGPFCEDCPVTWQLWQKQQGQSWKDLTPSANGEIASTAGTATNDVWTFERVNDDFTAYHWDGSTWTEKDPDKRHFVTTASKAVSRNSVWAAGRYDVSVGQAVPAVAHWDGQAWTVTKLPASMQTDVINAMTVNSDSDIWVVGLKNRGTMASDVYQPFAAHWDGTRWTESALPSSSPNSTQLLSVAGSGPDDVWLGGGVFNPSGEVKGGVTGGYVLHWDGRTWKRTDVPGSDLYLVSSLAYHNGRIWAALGTDQRGKGLARWTGTSWEFVNGPNGPVTSASPMTSTPSGALYVTMYESSDPVLASLAPTAQ